MDELQTARARRYLLDLEELKISWRLSDEQFALLLGVELHLAQSRAASGADITDLSQAADDRMIKLLRIQRLTAAQFPNDLGASWIQIFGNPGKDVQTPLLAMSTRLDGVSKTLESLQGLAPRVA